MFLSLPKSTGINAIGLRIRCLHASLVRAKRFVRPFVLADIGEGITECEVLKWHTKPTRRVLAFDPLCEVQSDKASVEITSPYEGTVTEILVQEGEVAKVGDRLCMIEVDEEVVAEEVETPSTAKEPVQPKSPAPTPAAEEKPMQKEVRRPHPFDPSVPRPTLSSNRGVLATPAVRHFARERGVDLSVIDAGSGKGGRIEKADIERHISLQNPRSEEREQTQMIVKDDDVVVELGRTRWAMWKSMTASLQIPHFGYSTTLDLTSLNNMLPILNAHIPSQYLPPPADKASRLPLAISPHAILPSPPTPLSSDPLSHYTKLTMLPFLLKALSHAMLAWPLFRSSITLSSSDKPSLTVRPHADISVALSTASGLYTPTIQHVDNLSPYEIAGQLKRLQSLGRQSPPALGPAELPKRGGTLAVSNVGAIGAGESAHPLLVPGIGVAIVAIGRAKWVEELDGLGPDGGQKTRRLKVGVSWSGDHRVVEGAELAAFVEEWRAWVENPERLIGAGR